MLKFSFLQLLCNFAKLTLHDFCSSRLNKMIIPICVGHTPQWASRIGRGENASAMGCPHDHVFYASDTPGVGMIPISIGNAGSGEEWRHSISQVSAAL